MRYLFSIILLLALPLVANAQVVSGSSGSIKTNQTTVLTAGYSVDPFNAGTQTSGAFTPDEARGNFQYAINGGAHTLVPPVNSSNMVILYTNDGSAGAVSTTGFTMVTGSTLTTTSGDDFLLYVTKLNNFSHLNVVALQ